MIPPIECPRTWNRARPRWSISAIGTGVFHGVVSPVARLSIRLQVKCAQGSGSSGKQLAGSDMNAAGISRGRSLSTGRLVKRDIAAIKSGH